MWTHDITQLWYVLLWPAMFAQWSLLHLQWLWLKVTRLNWILGYDYTVFQHWYLVVEHLYSIIRGKMNIIQSGKRETKWPWREQRIIWIQRNFYSPVSHCASLILYYYHCELHFKQRRKVAQRESMTTQGHSVRQAELERSLESETLSSPVSVT